MSAARDKFAFRIDEAADFLGVSRTTVYELVRAGQLELGRIAGRSVIKRAVLEGYAERAYTPSPPSRGVGAAR